MASLGEIGDTLRGAIDAVGNAPVERLQHEVGELAFLPYPPGSDPLEIMRQQVAGRMIGLQNVVGPQLANASSTVAEGRSRLNEVAGGTSSGALDAASATAQEMMRRTKRGFGEAKAMMDEAHNMYNALGALITALAAYNQHQAALTAELAPMAGERARVITSITAYLTERGL